MLIFINLAASGLKKACSRRALVFRPIDDYYGAIKISRSSARMPDGL